MDRSFFFGILVGVTAGAVVGLICAPRPGIDIRHDIADRSKHAAGRIGKLGRSVAGKAHGVEERIKQAI